MHILKYENFKDQSQYDLLYFYNFPTTSRQSKFSHSYRSVAKDPQVFGRIHFKHSRCKNTDDDDDDNDDISTHKLSMHTLKRSKRGDSLNSFSPFVVQHLD